MDAAKTIAEAEDLKQRIVESLDMALYFATGSTNNVNNRIDVAMLPLQAMLLKEGILTHFINTVHTLAARSGMEDIRYLRIKAKAEEDE